MGVVVDVAYSRELPNAEMLQLNQITRCVGKNREFKENLKFPRIWPLCGTRGFRLVSRAEITLRFPLYALELMYAHFTYLGILYVFKSRIRKTLPPGIRASRGFQAEIQFRPI